MNASKKSQYFRFIRSKKRKLDGVQPSDDNAVQKTTKGQKTISSFFASKTVKEKPLEQLSPTTRNVDDALKRKLDLFKSDVAAKEETTRQCYKKSKLDRPGIAENEEPEAASRSSKKKLTPLEQQVKEVKEKYPDTLLMVEVGYRYRFFGQDAERAADILDIVAHPDNVGSGQLGLTASVPTFNGPMNYVRKLVLQGEKVGIVSQTESAAEKTVNQTLNSGFSRQLTSKFTAATYLEEIYDDRNRTFHIMAVSNSSSALQLTPIVGKLILHKVRAKGLRDLLNALEPFEIIIGENECDVVQDYVHDQRHFRGNPVRLETVPMTNQSNLEELVFSEEERESNNGLLQLWPTLSQDDIQAFQMMYEYLKQFGLEKLLFNATFDISDLTTSNYCSNVMNLPQMTVDSLELYLLDKILNVAKTRPGKRLFKNWLYTPLTVQANIHSR